jgi:hypothetical protein
LSGSTATGLQADVSRLVVVGLDCHLESTGYVELSDPRWKHLCFLIAQMLNKGFYIPGPDGQLPPPTYFCVECQDESFQKQLRDATVSDATKIESRARAM